MHAAWRVSSRCWEAQGLKEPYPVSSDLRRSASATRQAACFPTPKARQTQADAAPDALKYMAAVETIIQHRMAYCHSELLELSEVDMDAISRDCGPFRSSYYVYGLVDPRNGHIFYIGKGRGDRGWQHRCDDDADTNGRKKRRISDIVRAGLEPEVRLLLRVPSEHVAYLIESALIAFLPGLTNIVGQRRNASTQECQARGLC